MKYSYVIVTAVRDEALLIEKTIDSVEAQTLTPSQWIIVDDGSSDGTSQLLDVRAEKNCWIKVLHRADRGYRLNGSGVMEAFHDGLSALDTGNWDFIAKLDGDLSFEPDYFERCFDVFTKEKELGIGGGAIHRLDKGQSILDSRNDPPFHVRGATKIYRRECWEKIEPLLKAPGWDTVDEVKANLNGWKTRSFEEITLLQHKATGSADGVWRDSFKNGKANYITGYHPVFMLAKCFNRITLKPFLVQPIALLAGFLSGYLTGTPQVQDQSAIRYLRRQQIQRLLLRRSIYG